MSKTCLNKDHSFGFIAINSGADEQCQDCGLTSNEALTQAIKEDLEKLRQSATWEWYCYLNLNPQSPRATSCCCNYTLVEFLQELATDILSHEKMYDEGFDIEMGESTGLPVFPFSLELLLMAATKAPLRAVLENRIRQSPKWTESKPPVEEEVKRLVDGLFPGGMCVISGQYWEQVTFYNSLDYMKRSGIPQPPYGLGFLKGGVNSYLQEFPDNSDHPPTDDFTIKLATPEVTARPKETNGPDNSTGATQRGQVQTK